VNARRKTLQQGTLNLRALKSLVPGELHGLGISRAVQQMTSGTFVGTPDPLFPALHGMEGGGSLRFEEIRKTTAAQNSSD
jgi:PadR family transcriptional regulator, regulatory protein PadR